MNKTIYFILIFLCLVSCSSSLYIPVTKDKLQEKQLLSGRKLYVDHCSSCHDLFFPEQFSKEQWQKNLNKMQRKAKISDEEKQLIFDYLVFKPEKQ